MKEASKLGVNKDVVNRNIKAGSDPNTADFKELTYEAYGVGGVGFIINCLSDNNNRATADVGTVARVADAATTSERTRIDEARAGKLKLGDPLGSAFCSDSAEWNL